MNHAVHVSRVFFNIRNSYTFSSRLDYLKRMFHKDYLSIVPYEVPKWAENLRCRPHKRVLLANIPTPIHRWKIPGVPKEFEVSIKRDDITGSGLSGNKVRKLEFIFAEAMSQGYKSVITCGSAQSNHCRATAVAARELGMDCHLLLRASDPEQIDISRPGNLLPSLLCNCSLYFIPKRSKYLTDIKPKQEALAKEIIQKTGEPAYCIPVGGSNATGLYGYIHAWHELMVEQNLLEDYDDVVMACGSGGSLAGMALGNYLTGRKLKVHGITVCDHKQYFHNFIDELLETVGFRDCKAEDMMDIIDGYKGSGYGMSTQEDREFYLKLAGETGIICDPVYTGKAVNGLLNELKINPQRFKGNRILFIHTGGVFSLYDGTITEEVRNKFIGDKTFVWPNGTDSYKRLFQPNSD